MTYDVFEEFKIVLPSFEEADNEENPLALAHFTNGAWDWYVIAGKKTTDDYMLLGLVNGIEKELGFFTLKQIEDVGAMFDIDFEPIGVFDIYEDFDLRRGAF